MDKAIRKIIEATDPKYTRHTHKVNIPDFGGGFYTKIVDFTKAIQLLKTPQKMSKKRKAIIKNKTQSNDTEPTN